MKKTIADDAVGKREIAVYSLAGGGQMLGYSLITEYIMYFYVNVFHVDPAVVGTVLFLEGLWDTVNNPLAGILIDRLNSNKDRMLPFLKYCSVPLAIFTVLLFSGPFLLGGYSPASPVKAAYVFITYFLWEALYTVTDVAYWGLSAAVSGKAEERAKIAKTVNITQTVFSSVPYVLTPLLIDYCSGERGHLLKFAFLILGAISAAGCCMFLPAGLTVKERVRSPMKQVSVLSNIKQLITNPLLRTLIAANLISAARGIGDGLSTYYFADVLGIASFSVLTQIPSVLAWLFSYRLLSALKKKLSNKKILVLASFIMAAVNFALFIFGYSRFDRKAPMLAAITAAQTIAAFLASPYSVVYNEMLAVATDYTEWKSGFRNEGLSFSVKIATQKAGSTTAKAVSSAVLSLLGYKVRENGGRQSQPRSVMRGIWSVYSLAPAISLLLSGAVILFYRFSSEEQEKMESELKKRRSSFS